MEQRDPSVEAVSVSGDVGEGKMMYTGDLVGGKCPAGDRETALDRHVDGGVCRPVDGGGGSARRWCAHFNIHERSVWDVPVCPPSGALRGGVVTSAG